MGAALRRSSIGAAAVARAMGLVAEAFGPWTAMAAAVGWRCREALFNREPLA